MKFTLAIWGNIWYNNSVVGRYQPGNQAGPGERLEEARKMDDLRLLVTTRDGLRECYNFGMLDKLMNDPAVYEIVDRETGEILFYD